MEMEEQIACFLVWLICGTGVGVLLDGYRVWADMTRIKRKTVAADCLVWCVLAIGVFIVSFYLNGAQLRFYFLLALGMGYVIYRRWFGDRVRYLWSKLLKAVRHVWRWIVLAVRTVRTPFYFLLKYILKSARYIKRQIGLVQKLPPKNKS